MDAAKWAKVKQVFAAALERDEHERLAFVAYTCGKDADLFREIASLLSSHQAAADFLQLSTDLVQSTHSQSADAAEIGGLRPEMLDRLIQRMAHLAGSDSLDEPMVSDTELNWPGEITQQYEILRELGRGGMGVVALARDRSLDRFVAIKRLSFRREDSSAAHRMVREARAIAQITSDHVVTIHHVIDYDGQAPWLVMEYVDGPSLAQRIRDAGPLPPREVATMMEQAARGIAAAHDVGIIHRDVKPGNILMSSTGDQKLPWRVKVTDFGLARIDTNDSKLTQAGAVLGTPAYMSPEQVATPQSIDRRTDVYALGATLYEALTGTVPFRGTPQMVLLQIEQDEPTLPRKLNDSVPRDLESICLKALDKSPDGRYASASDLGDDLRRWLNGEPIVARPIGRLQRCQRWCRRNPGLAALTTISLTLLVVVAAGSCLATWLVQTRNANLRDTNNQLVATNLNLDDARQAAEANSERAHEVVSQFFTDVSQSKELLGNAPGTQQLRTKLLSRALDYAETFLAENPDSRNRLEWARAADLLATIQGMTGQPVAAMEGFRKALEVYESHWRSDPQDMELGRSLTRVYRNVAKIADDLGQTGASMEYSEKAISLARQLLEREPSSSALRIDLANASQNLALYLKHQGDHSRASARYVEAIETLRGVTKSDPAIDASLADAQAGFALLLSDMGQRDQTEAALTSAIEVTQRLITSDPQDPELHSTLAQRYLQLAAHYRSCGDYASAQTTYDEAHNLLRDLVRDNPTVFEYRRQYVRALSAAASLSDEDDAALQLASHSLDAARELVRLEPDVDDNRELLAGAADHFGSMLVTIGKPDEGRTLREEAVAILEELAARTSADGYRSSIADICSSLAIEYGQRGDMERAIDVMQRAIGIWREQLARNSDLADTQDELSLALGHLGVMYYKQGDNITAASSIRESLDVARDLTARVPDVPAYRFRLAVALIRSSGILDRMGDAETAVQMFDESIRVLEQLVSDHPDAPNFAAVLADQYVNRGDHHHEDQEYDAAAADYVRADQILVRIMAQSPNDTRYARIRLRLLNNQGALYSTMGDASKALETFHRAEQADQQMIALFPDRLDVQHDLAYAQENLGQLYLQEGELDQAIDYLTGAEELTQQLIAHAPQDPEFQERLPTIRELLISALGKRIQRTLDVDVPSPESPQQAVDDATRLCALQEWKDWGSLAKLASALNAAGRTVEARQRLQEALTLAPDNQRGALEQQLSEIE